MTDSVFLDGLAAIVGPDAVLASEQDKAPYLREWRDLYRGEARAVVQPASVAEVCAVVRHCAGHGVKIVPQGGNTGLVGGQIPTGIDAVVVSTRRLARVRAVDPLTDTMTVEAGLTLACAQQAAEDAGRLFPLSLASEGSCTVGGTIATNAGGTAVLAYGNMRELVLGLEVVLADGTVWNGLSRLRKDNTGYDLKNLFIGAEGTLGIVTAAVLKLVPRPAARATAFCAVPDPAAAVRLLARLKAAAGTGLVACEIMPRFGLEVVLRHGAGARDPLGAPSPWYLLIELAGNASTELEGRLQATLEAAFEAGEAIDAAVAGSLEQRRALWSLRELMSEVQRLEGGSIKHDVSVPVALVPELIERASYAVRAAVPGARPLPFGHLGDGNIHLNISQPQDMDKAAFLARWDEVNHIVHKIVIELGGSISAEHGIGRLKRDLLREAKDPVAYALMKRLKTALDPENIFNPGAVLADGP